MYHSTVPWIQVDLADLVHPEHLEAPEQITLKIVKKQKMKKIKQKCSGTPSYDYPELT